MVNFCAAAEAKLSTTAVLHLLGSHSTLHAPGSHLDFLPKTESCAKHRQKFTQKNFKSLEFNFWRYSHPVTPVKGVMADTKPTEPVRARASTRAESLTDVVKRRADRTFEIRQ